MLQIIATEEIYRWRTCTERSRSRSVSLANEKPTVGTASRSRSVSFAKRLEEKRSSLRLAESNSEFNRMVFNTLGVPNT